MGKLYPLKLCASDSNDPPEVFEKKRNSSTKAIVPCNTWVCARGKYPLLFATEIRPCLYQNVRKRVFVTVAGYERDNLMTKRSVMNKMTSFGASPIKPHEFRQRPFWLCFFPRAAVP
jgi:hypothetical protein